MAAMITGVCAVPRRRMLAGLPVWFALVVAARAQPTQTDAPPAQTRLPPPQTDVPPARVTSDSPAFCAQLANQVRQETRAHPPAPVLEEVTTLRQEGTKMCNEGHLRPGILRLRRALQILRGEEADPR